MAKRRPSPHPTGEGKKLGRGDHPLLGSDRGKGESSVVHTTAATISGEEGEQWDRWVGRRKAVTQERVRSKEASGGENPLSWTTRSRPRKGRAPLLPVRLLGKKTSAENFESTETFPIVHAPLKIHKGEKVTAGQQAPTQW